METGINRRRAQNCFERTQYCFERDNSVSSALVSSAEQTSWAHFGKQNIGQKELSELSPKNSVRANNNSLSSVKPLQKRIQPISESNPEMFSCATECQRETRKGASNEWRDSRLPDNTSEGSNSGKHIRTPGPNPQRFAKSTFHAFFGNF